MSPPTAAAPATSIGPPFWLLAELTYDCPLHCPFCSNPVDFALHGPELTTADWLRVLDQARALGAVQVGFSGGEPLQRKDLEILVAEARRLGYYSNLLTSGIGLNPNRISALKAAGLDHIQLSFQDSTREINDFLGSTRTFERKRQAAALIKQHDYPMVMNCVIHRLNIDHIDRIIELAVDIGADYLELANVQFAAWAQLNRTALLPTREQLERAEATTAQWRERLGDSLKLLYVVPDYYEGRPKKCMNGWGQVFLTVAPDGTALPCHTARMLPGAPFPNVREHELRDIWYRSEGFNRYRGDHWMHAKCRACPEQQRDLSGCRCQAYMLTGDPAAIDPTCALSPQHGLITDAIDQAQRLRADEKPLIFRGPLESRRLQRAF